jgi:hypothetical protein
MVWVRTNEETKFFANYGRIESLEETEDGQDNKVLIRYEMSYPRKEWVPTRHVRWESNKKDRAMKNRRVLTTIPDTTISSRISTPTKKKPRLIKAVTPSPKKVMIKTKKTKKTSHNGSNAVVVLSNTKPTEVYYQVEKILGFRFSMVKEHEDVGRPPTKSLLFEIKWVGDTATTWEPVSCLDQQSFEEAKALVLEALEKQRLDDEATVDPDLVRIAMEDLGIHENNTVVDPPLSVVDSESAGNACLI